MSIASWKVRTGVACALVACGVCTLAGRANGQAPPPGMTTTGATAPTVSTGPVIISLNAVQIPGQKFRISGTVASNTPASCSVSISGAATGTLQCDASGNFSGDLAVATPGPITAVASDGQSNSPAVGTTLTNAAPTITIQATLQGNVWTFSGVVTDEAPAGLTVTLSGNGLDGQTATVLANGTWSISLTLPPTAGGMVTATVTDWYGQTGSSSTLFGS